jgi:hypothetical protein
MVRTQISLTQEQHAAVHALAERRGESMSAIIRDAVDRLVSQSQMSAAEVLLEFAGTFEPLDPDEPWVDHDTYLYGPDVRERQPKS